MRRHRRDGRLGVTPHPPDPVRLGALMDDLLGEDDRARELRYPGPSTGWQPVHTVYIPADRFDELAIVRWGEQAVGCLDEHGPVPGYENFDAAIRNKLRSQPIEDVRIDFEDGYGLRSDADEDAAINSAVASVLAQHRSGQLPPAWGIRIKCLEPSVRQRAVRTYTLFLQSILEGQSIPDGFRVTLPKVTTVGQISAMVTLCAELEAAFGLPATSLRFEIQVETPQAIVGADGVQQIAPMLHAAQGRCAGLHYGTYDYSASVGIAAAFQSLEHPAADYAKAVMQVAAAGTGVPVSDGSTNILPVGTAEEVRAGWALHARLVRRSLERGFYQGWDLHPAQLPTRYAATFGFYAAGLPTAVTRLEHYLSRAASGVLDEPATARALAGFLLRGLNCGAVSQTDVAAHLSDPGLLDRSVLERLQLTGL